MNKMTLYNELPVYRKVYKLILMIGACAKDFSKEHKYTLGENMKRDALQLVKNSENATLSSTRKNF
jgi:hypothetical protein|uniref:hypothetical protein n=1 Tax=Algoriphagus sp. TaxID=1872435 RepID=UPI004047548A